MPQALFANPWTRAAAAALCLGLAAPPGAFPFAGWLVLPGLALLYTVVTAVHRPVLLAYLVGCVAMASFSWSVRHVLFAAYVAIVLLGGVYFAILPRWVKGLAALRVLRPLAFGIAIAGTHWLRAHMPEIWYPHGQPAHALYHWPWMLGTAAFGGEVLGNLVLAASAAAVVDACAGVRRRASVILFLALLVIGVGAESAVRSLRDPANGTAIDIAAIQPGLSIDDLFLRDATALAQRQRATLVQPTLAVAGVGVQHPADLVLWPESTAHVELLVDAEAQAQLAAARWWCADRRLLLAPASKLLVGGHMTSPRHDGVAAALLLDHGGRLLGHHEKLRLVPGGERQPFFGWLPDAWSAALRARMAQTLGAAPHLQPGAWRAPLEVLPGVRVAALLCYDNAFAEVASDAVRAGANLLVVLSNEVWYRGGAELDQMEAMSVCRALETGVPLVRATVDGATIAVDPDGRIVARVERAESATLRIRVTAPANTGPVAPAAPTLSLICALSLVFAIAQGLWAWARLRRSYSQNTF